MQTIVCMACEFWARGVTDMGDICRVRQGRSEPGGCAGLRLFWAVVRGAGGGRGCEGSHADMRGLDTSRRFFAAPGPQSIDETSAPTVVGAHSYVAGPRVTRRRPPPPYRTGCVRCGLSRVVGRPPRRSTRARGRPRQRQWCASLSMPRLGAPSGGAAGFVRATRSRSRRVAGLAGGA